MQRSNWILKVLKCKNKIYQPIELEEQMKKIRVVFLVIMFTPGVIVFKISKNGSFFVFFAGDSKI